MSEWKKKYPNEESYEKWVEKRKKEIKMQNRQNFYDLLSISLYNPYKYFYL